MGKMTIQEIAKILIEKNKLSQKDANQFAATMFEIIQQQLDNEGLVKVKGLGTFKMIRVEARESVSVRTGERVMIDSHAKVTFTPDATMKELVNKPFSQFDTVILNDGVEFDDLADDLTEEELAEVERMEEETIVTFKQPPVGEPVGEPVEKPEVPIEPIQPINPIEPTEPTAQPQPLLEVVEDEKQEEIPQEEPQREEPIYYEDEESSGSWLKVLGYILLTLALMAASAYGGYWYAHHKDFFDFAKEKPATAPEVIATDSIEDISADTTATEAIPETEQPAPESRKEEPKAEEPKKEEVKKESSEEPIWKKYEAMDVRVRTGAYHIVGTDHEVKARKGETLARIARRELGEDMSCYLEVYNDMKPNTELKEGQIVKIPKLKWKKRY
ncbi:MAG: HU family DNA-binding protein [Prevotella sp.]|nr:HU family DNA-binding protein [Prevotella sp.]